MDIYKLLPHFFQFLGNPVFSGVAIVAGFAGLIWQAVRQARTPGSIPVHQLVHPDTKLPVSSKPHIWPKIKRPVWTCVLATIIALVIWIGYKTPLRSFAFVQQFPVRTIPIQTPPPPKIETIVPKVHQSSGIRNPIAAHVQASAIPSTVAPSQQPQKDPIPIPASAPLVCPSPGTLAQGWDIVLQEMMGGSSLNQLPIENGPITFAIVGPGVLHPLLVGKVSMPVGRLRGSQIQEAEALLEDLKPQVGSPAPLPYRSSEKLERFINRVERIFQSPVMLTVAYVDGARGSADGVRTGNTSVPITSLSSRSQAFVNKLDTKAKAGADQSCKDSLKNLTQDE